MALNAAYNNNYNNIPFIRFKYLLTRVYIYQTALSFSNSSLLDFNSRVRRSKVNRRPWYSDKVSKKNDKTIIILDTFKMLKSDAIYFSNRECLIVEGNGTLFQF